MKTIMIIPGDDGFVKRRSGDSGQLALVDQKWGSEKLELLLRQQSSPRPAGSDWFDWVEPPFKANK